MPVLRVDLLGIMEVVQENRRFTPGAPKLRQTLGMLAVSPGRFVATETIATELWPVDRPRKATTTIQTYIYELRKALGGGERAGTEEVLRTDGPGYRLRVGAEDIDASRFLRLVNQADRLLDEDRRRRRAGRDPQDNALVMDAGEVLREALRLWKGRPFTGTPTGPHLGAHARFLEQAWVRALERRIRTDLLLGHHRELVGELKALTAEHHLNETFHAQLMIALYRSGRRAEAFEVYAHIHDALHDELGLEPTTRLKSFRNLIMAGHADERSWPAGPA